MIPTTEGTFPSDDDPIRAMGSLVAFLGLLGIVSSFIWIVGLIITRFDWRAVYGVFASLPPWEKMMVVSTILMLIGWAVEENRL